jgi:outer membrane protein assembly factor BamD (BamD/ComL family)
MKKLLITYLTILITINGTYFAKRHSRELKIERFERKAQEAAKENTLLAKALSKRTKGMSFDEAAVALNYYKDQKHNDMIIKCGERLLAVGGNQEVMRQARLDLAQAFLDQNKYTEAEKHALDYLTYYPGAQESKNASYIAIKALFLSQGDSSRNQQKTRDTIEQAEIYLKKYPTDTQHTEEIQDILDKSYLKLIRNEINVIETQINMYHYANRKGALKGANKRIAYLKKQYLKHAPQAERKLLELEITLAQTEGNAPLIAEKKAELAKLGTPKLAQEESIFSWQRYKGYFTEDNQKYFA